MVTGKVPFDADTPVSVALKHMQEKPEEPVEVNPNVPIAVNNIIMKALQKDTNLRYQTATDMLDDLRKALKNPDGDFVDDSEYDPTAKTQVLNTEMYNNLRSSRDDEEDNKGKKEKGFKAFIKRHKKLSIFIGLILLFALSLGGTMFALNITNPPEVDMPKVVGLSEEEARQEVENAKLIFEVSSEEFNKDVPEGYVISQKAESDLGDFTTTPGDKKVKEGSKVLVIISKGQEKTTVPKVVGMEKDEAIKALEEENLVAEVIEETSRTVEEGYVISQEIEEGTEAFAGDTVKIHVSTGTGIKQVTVISVIGQDEATAKSNLENLGLKVNVTYNTDNSKENGVVLEQSVNANKVVDEGTTITITVNKKDEMKSGTVKVNLKSLLNYTPIKDEEGEEVIEKGKLRIMVGDDKIYEQEIDKTSTDINASFSAKGNVIIKVYVDDILEGTQEINMNDTNTCVFE